MRRDAALVVGRHADLAFHRLDGRPMFVHALTALSRVADPVVVVEGQDLPRVRDVVHRVDPGVRVRTETDWWADLAEAPPAALLVHDVRCPLVTSTFVSTVLAAADAASTHGVVAVRPVTDTLKSVVDERIDTTIDRDQLVTISSPVVVPLPAMRAARRSGTRPPCDDFAALVAWLRTHVTVDLVRAPSLGRRVEHARAVHVLECLHEVGRRVRVSHGRAED